MGRALGSRLYESVLRRAILPLGDRALGQRMMSRLRFMERAQRWSVERLRDYQAERLRELLRVSYREVPFYRRQFESVGLKPADVKTPLDLAKLPVTRRVELRDAPKRDKCRDTGTRLFETATSGSTGTPFKAYQDAENEGRCRAASLLGFLWSGWAIGEAHVQNGITPERGWVKAVKDRLLRGHYMSAFDCTDDTLDRVIDLMQRRDIRHVRGFPGVLVELARRLEETDLAPMPMRSVATWGDNLYAHFRDRIERVFEHKVIDQYGCAEGIRVASQCERAECYHIFSTEVVVEVVDDSGQPVAVGERGRVLLTRLYPGPMPFVRYEVGDLGRLAPSDRMCECGRGFPLLERIDGRDTDIIHTPDGNHLVVHVFTGIFEHFEEIRSFQIVQEELASISVKIVPAPGYSDKVEQRLLDQLQRHGLGSLEIQIERVAAIELPANQKRRFVISKLPAPNESRTA